MHDERQNSLQRLAYRHKAKGAVQCLHVPRNASTDGNNPGGSIDSLQGAKDELGTDEPAARKLNNCRFMQGQMH